MNITAFFEKNFTNHSGNMSELFVPYRVCPLGAHIDHQKGIVTGFALDKGVESVFSPSGSSTVRIISCNIEGETVFSLDDELKKTQSWGDYAKAAAWSLNANGCKVKKGFYAVINGELSAGGLSSSAAVLLTYIRAFCAVNEISLSSQELISIAHMAETKFIGLNCGTLDQSCEVLCKKDSLLVLDTLNSGFYNIPCSADMPDFEIGVFFSGLSRSLVTSNYNLRTEELRSSVTTLKMLANIDTSQDVLREIPYEVFRKYSCSLAENQRKRCEHYYSEMQRVQKGVDAFRGGDINAFGKCIFESGLSSVNNYEAGSPELICLYEILCETDGVYGARFSGAGFKGCCMAIIDPLFKEEIKNAVNRKYISSFPHLADKISTHFCKTADGCAE